MINATNQLRPCPEGVLGFKRFRSNWISTPAVRSDDVNFSSSIPFRLVLLGLEVPKWFKGVLNLVMLGKNRWDKIKAYYVHTWLENLRSRFAYHRRSGSLFVQFALLPYNGRHVSDLFVSFMWIRLSSSPRSAVESAYLRRDECLFYLQILLPIYLFIFYLILLATINTRRSVMMIYPWWLPLCFAATDRLSAS